ncbi:MAG: enoyl-CoA hydratase-related protein [Actinomycetota bacterium]|nr:enoyl-CoA hydratase-related protein [Actinomycetota bacterium]
MSIVDVSITDGVATVTLNDPDHRNSLSAPMVEALVSAFDGLESSSSVGAVVITGAPPAFCAGADLGNLAEADGASLRSIYEGFLRVARSPLPTLAAVNGAAVGAVRVLRSPGLSSISVPTPSATEVWTRLMGPSLAGGPTALRSAAPR